MGFERVIKYFLLRHPGPAFEKVDGLLDVGIPDGLGRVAVVLRHALAQTSHGRSPGSVHVQGQQIVATDAGRPGGIELRNHATFQLKRGVAGVVSGTLVGVTLLVDALFDMSSTQTRYGFDSTKQVVQYVAPVAEHVHDDTAVVFLTVIPGRALRGYAMPLEHPVAKFTPYRQDFAKKSRFPSTALVLACRVARAYPVRRRV